jgi:hypothetical protein
MNMVQRVIVRVGTTAAVILALAGLPNLAQATEHTTGHKVGKVAAFAEICGYGSQARQVRTQYGSLPDFSEGYKYWRKYLGKYDAVRTSCGTVKNALDQLTVLDPAALGAQEHAEKATPENFDGRWIFEIADADNFSVTDTRTVEIQDNQFAVKFSINGWHGQIRGEINKYGRMVGRGNVSGPGWGRQNLPLKFVAEHRSGEFGEDVLIDWKGGDSILRIRFSRQTTKVECSSTPCEDKNEGAVASLPDNQSTQEISAQPSKNVAKAIPEKFDGKWVFEISDVDNLSNVDRQIVEVRNGNSRAEVSFNGWHGTIALEIDKFGKLTGSGTVNGLGFGKRNALVKFTSVYDAGGFREDVLSGNRLNQTFRIKLTRETDDGSPTKHANGEVHLQEAFEPVEPSPEPGKYQKGLRAFELGEYAVAAREWLEFASQGDVTSQFRLAQLYEEGLGVPQDFVQAHRWYNVAGSRGHAEAREARDTLANRMTANQLAEAQRLATETSLLPQFGRNQPDQSSVDQINSNFNRHLSEYERWRLFPQRFEEYKATSHYRALAIGYIDRWERVFFPTTGHATVGQAIDAAYEGCDLELEKRGRDWECGLFAIGDIDISEMTQEQVQQVIELYESNTSATNEDFVTISEQIN